MRKASGGSPQSWAQERELGAAAATLQGLQGAGEGDRIQNVNIKTKEGLETSEPALLLVGKSIMFS